MIYIDFLQSSMDLCHVKSDNCQGWSPTIPRMATHQPKDGHPPEGSMLQTRNLALRPISQNYDLVTTDRNIHLPSLGWSSTNPRMVTLNKEEYYRLGIGHLDLPHKTTARMLTSTQAWAPTKRTYTTDLEFMTKT